jgi:UDP-galactopyranose mutase
VPLRFTYDNNYFSDPYQGIPINGYTAIVEKMLCGIELKLNEDYLADREAYRNVAAKIIYTGAIDEYYDYCYGALEYRGLTFETEYLPIENYQGVAVMNYTDRETPYTRVIEHKHFEFGEQPDTIVTKEYPALWKPGYEAYYPVNDDKNQILFARYKAISEHENDICFGGRLGTYRYLDMDDVMEEALKLATE